MSKFELHFAKNRVGNTAAVSVVADYYILIWMGPGSSLTPAVDLYVYVVLYSPLKTSRHTR